MFHSLKILTAIALLVPFALGTEPTLPPYHQFSVAGTIERRAGESRKDFAVTLFGKFALQSGSGFQNIPTEGSLESTEIRVGLTDSSGTFFVRVNSRMKIDSLVVAVVVPDRPIQLGVPFGTDDANAVPHTETSKSGGESGCAGCSTAPETQHRTVFYSHYFENKAVTILF